MTPRTKEILKDALNIYKAMLNPDDKQNLINSVKKNLSIHYNGINTIGIGLDEDKVRAGEIFLRIYNK